MNSNDAPRRPVGRPRIDPAAGRSVDVHLTLPPPLYDKAWQAARDARQTVNAWIRDAVHSRIGTLERPRRA